MDNLNEVDLLLIGKTGTGKSATGNSILKRKAFKSNSSATSVTKNIQSEISDFNGRIIKVVDGPGVGDTELKTDEAVKKMLKAMNYAIAMNSRGYHAFLLVFRFGGRFTAEDQDTVSFLKKVFGPDFVKNFCILLLTCGDNFEQDSEETGKSFSQWCKEQQGYLQELMKECDKRVVLFDNRTKDENKKNKQIEHLLKVVDNLSSRGNRYTDENFARATEERKKIMIELKKSAIEEQTMNETSLIYQKLGEAQAEGDLKRRVALLRKLQTRAETLSQSLSSQDQGTGVLHDLTSNVESMKNNIMIEITICLRFMKEREVATRRLESYEKEIQLLKEHLQTKVKNDGKLIVACRSFQAEQEKLRKQMEVMNKRHEEECKALKIKNEELDTMYRGVKNENDKGIVERIVGVIKWPIKKLLEWIESKLH